MLIKYEYLNYTDFSTDRRVLEIGMLHSDMNKVNFDKLLNKDSYGQLFSYGNDPEDDKWILKYMQAEDTEELPENYG